MNRKKKIIVLIILITLAYITPMAVNAAQTIEGHMEALPGSPVTDERIRILLLAIFLRLMKVSPITWR
jgi:hypothetical protein